MKNTALSSARVFFHRSYHTPPLKRRLSAVLCPSWARTLINVNDTLPSDSKHDVVIVGGGVMGWSSAFFLARRIPGDSICVIERDTKVICCCILLCVCVFLFKKEVLSANWLYGT